MSKKTMYVLAMLAIAAFTAFYYLRERPTERGAQNQEEAGASPLETADARPEPIAISPSLPSPTLPLSNDPKDIAWNLFQKYLSYNKNQDLNGVKSVVYKISEVCNTKEASQDCKNRMQSAYSYGSSMKKEDFKNIWSDQKQIILSTDFWQEGDDSAESLGRFRSIMFFVKKDGEWKLLSFSPIKGAAVNRGEASVQEIKDRLVTYTEDNDQDGVSDYIEQCVDESTKNTCKPTDPKKRDTDGDGWWDGAQNLF